MIGNVLESRYSSEIQPGSFTNAELGALNEVVFTVAHLAVVAQEAPTLAVQFAGNAGATTASKFCAQGTTGTEHPVIVILSILAPVPETLLSVARRNLKTTFCPFADAGRLTVVVTNPPELPVHAWRPAIGLPKFTLMVPL